MKKGRGEKAIKAQLNYWVVLKQRMHYRMEDRQNNQTSEQRSKVFTLSKLKGGFKLETHICLEDVISSTSESWRNHTALKGNVTLCDY